MIRLLEFFVGLTTLSALMLLSLFLIWIDEITLNILRDIAALRREGISHPWRLAFAVHFKIKFLPHRTYLYSDHEGNVYHPSVLQWNIGPWMIWQSKKRNIVRKLGDLSAEP